jgi:hypothetical protein
LSSLEKLDVPVLDFGCSSFYSFRMKIKKVENTKKI